MGVPYEPQYLDVIQAGGHRNTVIVPQPGKEGLISAKDAEKCMLQTYMEGWGYTKDKGIYYGGYVCEGADRIGNMAWSGNDLAAKSVMSSFNAGERAVVKGILIETAKLPADRLARINGVHQSIKDLRPGQLVYYAWDGGNGIDGPQSAATGNAINVSRGGDIQAAKHMGMAVQQNFIDYDIQTEQLVLKQNPVVHSGVNTKNDIRGTYLSDLSNPAEPFDRFFLYRESININYD